MIHQVFAFADLHFGTREELFFFFFSEDSVDFIVQGFDFRGPRICVSGLYDARNDFCTLRLRTSYSLFYNFTVWFGGDGARAAKASGSGGTTDAVQVDFVGLGGFVVEDGEGGGDVEAAGGEVCGEEVGCLRGAEGC